MKLSLRPHCTCESMEPTLHYLNCDLMHRSNHVPRKKKRYFFFYPLQRADEKKRR